MNQSAKNPKSLMFTVALVCTFLAVLVHGYLALRHFEVSLGQPDSDSLCNINDTFNCDSVMASSFSTLFGIPLALWGAMTNLILWIMALTVRLTWDDQVTSTGRWTVRFSTLVLGASVIMASVSLTQMQVFCPFCIYAYVLSLITFVGFFFFYPSGVLENLSGDLMALFKDQKGTLTMIALIPIGAWLFNGMGYSKYKTSQKDIEKFVRFQTNEWKVAKQHDFSGVKGLELGAGASDAKMTIYEFADFLCGHCKAAAPKLHAFAKTHPGVRLVFLNYPLDASCNSAMRQAVGNRCDLAKATLCASKQDKGWIIHDEIFVGQAKLQRQPGKTREFLEEISTKHQIEWPKMKDCLDSEETKSWIQQQTDLGNRVGVTGTPAVFVNGRKLLGGQNINLLKSVYAEL